jgi:hypothetical protein
MYVLNLSVLSLLFLIVKHFLLSCIILIRSTEVRDNDVSLFMLLRFTDKKYARDVLIIDPAHVKWQAWAGTCPSSVGGWVVSRSRCVTRFLWTGLCARSKDLGVTGTDNRLLQRQVGYLSWKNLLTRHSQGTTWPVSMMAKKAMDRRTGESKNGDPDRLGCDGVPLDEWFPTFRRKLMLLNRRGLGTERQSVSSQTIWFSATWLWKQQIL